MLEVLRKDLGIVFSCDLMPVRRKPHAITKSIGTGIKLVRLSSGFVTHEQWPWVRSCIFVLPPYSSGSLLVAEIKYPSGSSLWRERVDFWITVSRRSMAREESRGTAHLCSSSKEAEWASSQHHLGWTNKPQGPPPDLHFLKQGSDTQRLHNLPRLIDKLHCIDIR